MWFGELMVVPLNGPRFVAVPLVLLFAGALGFQGPERFTMAATVEFIQDNRLAENAQVQGARLREGLEALKAKHPCVGDVRGMGLMQALEVVDPASPDGKVPDPKKVVRVFEETRRLGLLIGKGGLYGNVIRLTPPLIVSAREIDDALEVLDRAFAATT